MHKWKIFFICWIAGAWKWTLIKWLLKEVSLNLKLVLSYKTREPRIWEILWKDYVKLSVSEFKEAINRKEFLEYNFVHNQDYYWTKFVDVVDNGINTWINVVKEIDPLILPKLLEEKKIDRKDFLIIFLHISPEIVKERMLDRWDDINWNDYKNRLESARKEEELLHLADYVIDATKTKEEVLNEAIRIIKLCISTL
jgi:guanylate kinase